MSKEPSNVKAGVFVAMALFLGGTAIGWMLGINRTESRWHKAAVEHNAGWMVKNHSGGDIFLFWDEIEDAKSRGVKIRKVN